jgi:hypothetical protein
LDILGRTVATVDEGSREPGNHSVQLNSAGFRTGLYFLRLETPQGVAVKPVVVMK